MQPLTSLVITGVKSTDYQCVGILWIPSVVKARRPQTFSYIILEQNAV